MDWNSVFEFHERDIYSCNMWTKLTHGICDCFVFLASKCHHKPHTDTGCSTSLCEKWYLKMKLKSTFEWCTNNNKIPRHTLPLYTTTTPYMYSFCTMYSFIFWKWEICNFQRIIATVWTLNKITDRFIWIYFHCSHLICIVDACATHR